MKEENINSIPPPKSCLLLNLDMIKIIETRAAIPNIIATTLYHAIVIMFHLFLDVSVGQPYSCPTNLNYNRSNLAFRHSL